MKVLRVMSLIALLGVMAILSGGCACRTDSCVAESYGTLTVCITTTLPLMYYYGCSAVLEVWGPDGFYAYKDVPMYMGNQMVLFRNVSIGKYVATLSYNGMVSTKCALLCGNGEAVWRSKCMQNLKDMLNTKRGKESWVAREKDEDFCCADKECCDCSVCFYMPDDVFKYDP